MRFGALLAACALAVGAGAAARQALDEHALSQALTLGRGQRFDELQRFHAGYHVQPGAGIVTELDVITLYRRAVLLAEGSARLGERWTTRDLARALAPHADSVAVHANVRLHPHNTFVTAPPYSIELRGPADRQVAPVHVNRVPLYPPRAPRGAAMSAVSVEAVFDVRVVEMPDCCEVVILDQAGTRIATARVELARFR
jgi:hypothetical protein